MNDSLSEKYDQFLHFVTGGAGTGKTRLIKAVYQTLVRYFDSRRQRNMQSPSVLLTAPTGKAAFNMSGQTLHTCFQRPASERDSTGLTTLSASISQSMSVALSDL